MFDTLPNGEHFILDLVAQSPEMGEVQIPTHGRFALILEGGGDSVQVLDSDARDGEARARLPAQMLEGFIQAQGSKDMVLTYHDPLYYVNQELGQNGYRIGKRPFPIPMDWYTESPHYIFNFTNNGATRILMRWYSTDKTPDYPVGMAKIGPEGGTVDLPGVGRLKISEGALNSEMNIVLKQVLKTKTIFLASSVGNQEAYEFISPVLVIEPQNFVMNSTGRLYLETLLERLGKNHPSLINWIISDDNEHWAFIGSFINDINFSIEFQRFRFYSQVFPIDIDSTDQYQLIFKLKSSDKNQNGSA